VTTQGGEGPDWMEGTDEEDYLAGLGGADIFLAGPGTDGIAGGEGEDVYRLPGPETDYVIAPEGLGWRVTGPLGTAYLVGIERLEFGDGTTRPLAANFQ
jgi:Ca2+-binding RTX toxin-like protein